MENTYFNQPSNSNKLAERHIFFFYKKITIIIQLHPNTKFLQLHIKHNTALVTNKDMRYKDTLLNASCANCVYLIEAK